MSTTWIKTQNMDKYMIQLTWGIENSQTHGNKTEWWLPVTGGKGGKLLSNGYGVSILEDKKCSRNLLYSSVNIFNTTEFYL